MANSEGGTRSGMVVHWPKGITTGGEVRTQYSHVIDLLPTTLEVVGVSAPSDVRGIEQTPIQGTSLVYSFADATAPARRKTQYYFLYGSGSVYHDGWKASFGYRPDFIDLYQSYPVPLTAENKAGKETWELYNVDSDPTELRNLAATNPAKLRELQALFDSEAKRNQVYSLINWSDLFIGIQRFRVSLGCWRRLMHLEGFPQHVTLRDGTHVVIRPLRAIDGSELLEFYRAFPEEERQFLRDDVSSPEWVDRFLKKVDFEQVVSLVAEP